MLTKLEQRKKQWGGNQVIDQWLQDRQSVLVAYCELAGIPPYENHDRQLPSNDEIKRFCQRLMDYISAGHFEIFDNIVAQCKTNGERNSAQAKALYPKINQSTDFALLFNDTFADSTNNNQDFDSQLAKLGQQLEERFTLEDELLAILHTFHS